MAGPAKPSTAVEGSASDFVVAARSSAQITGVVVCDSEGTVTEAHGVPDAESLAAHVAVTARHLAGFAEALGLGRLESLQAMGTHSLVLLANEATLVALCTAPDVTKAEIDRVTNRITKGLGREPVPFVQVPKGAGSTSPRIDRRDPALDGPDAGPPARGPRAETPQRGSPDARSSMTPKATGARAASRAQDRSVVSHRGQGGLSVVEFEVLKKRLADAAGDPAALRSAIHDDSAAFRGWLERVPRSIAHALARGRMSEADVIRDLAVRAASTLGGELPKGLEGALLEEAVPRILRALNAVERAEPEAVTAVEEIEQKLVPAHPLKWALALWLADWFFGLGDVNRGMEAAQRALGLVQDHDAEAEGLAMSSIAEAHFEAGWSDVALKEVEAAKALALAVDDRPTRARLLFLEGRTHAALGRGSKCFQAVEEACEVHPAYGPAFVFLARQAIKEDKLWKAEALLREASSADPSSSLLARELKLVAEIRDGKLSFMVASEFLRLDEAMPTEEVIKKLRDLESMAPDFADLKLALGLKLVRLGRLDEAHTYLGALIRPEVSVEVRTTAEAALARIHVARPELRPREPKPDPNATQSGRDAGREGMGLGTIVGGPTETAPPSPSVFSGELQLFPLPDLLEFLRVGRRTGALVVSTPSGSGVIYLRDGMITGAASPQSKDVEEILLQKGILTPEQLERATRQRVQQPQRLLGDILMENRLVDASVLGEALVTQSYGAVGEMVHWTSGRFAFDPGRGDDSTPQDVSIALDTQRVVLDVFRMFDEDTRDRMES